MVTDLSTNAVIAILKFKSCTFYAMNLMKNASFVEHHSTIKDMQFRVTGTEPHLFHHNQ
jgi:hypothetical protein